MARFRGLSECKTPGCVGHRAGYRYANRGGTQPGNNRSFNAGMRIALGTFVTPAATSRPRSKKK